MLAKSKTKAEISAEWRAYDRVLAWLNTLETRQVSKSDVYAAVMEMRPSSFPKQEPVKG